MARELESARAGARDVYITPSQADAAKLIVERDAAKRRETPEAIRIIAASQAGGSPGVIASSSSTKKDTDPPPPDASLLAFLSYVVVSPERTKNLTRLIWAVFVMALFVAGTVTAILIASHFEIARAAGLGTSATFIGTTLAIWVSAWIRRRRRRLRHATQHQSTDGPTNHDDRDKCDLELESHDSDSETI